MEGVTDFALYENVRGAAMTTKRIEWNDQEGQHLKQRDDRLEAMSWGAFFVWVGATLLFDVELGIGLVGVAIITLGTQAIRSRNGLGVEGFWVVVGLCFLVGGIWERFAITLPLVPLLLIGLGIIIFLTGGKRRRRVG